jgi:hypothetical protein
MRRHLGLFLLALTLASTADAATLVIVNKDPAGVGFNDPTGAAPVGGNNGTTLGAQRMNVFLRAAQIWGEKFATPLTIKVAAQFGPLECTSNSGVLGQAGPATAFRNFANAPQANVWYAVALASSLAGTDLAAGLPDGASITASFNSNIGTPGCISFATWYLGLDGNTPAGKIDLLETVLHEFGHGLGFLSFVSLQTGALANGSPDAYTLGMFDNTTQMRWSVMSDAQRFASMKNNGNLVFDGTNATAASGLLTAGKDGAGHPKLYAPSTIQPGSSISHFDTTTSPDQLMEPSDTPVTNHVVDVPNDLTMPLLRDLGWQQASGGGGGCFTLTTAVSPGGSGSVAVNTAQNCAGGYTSGTAVQLTATGAGATFSNWSSIGGGSFTSTTANPGTYTITGNSTVTANFTVAGGSTSELITNGGFESATATGNTAPGWTVQPTAGHSLIQKGASFPRTGTAYAFLGGTDNSVDVIRQTITIPSSATAATLTFWVNIVTQEVLGDGAFDALYVLFQQPNGTHVATAAAFSNENATLSSNTNGTYFQVTVNVLSLKGSTLQLVFEGDTDVSLPTTFRIDDVSLQVTTPGNPAPTTSITSPANGATVSGTVSVNATASDDTSVSTLEIWIDGVMRASNANATSLSYSWDTTLMTNGAHAIVSKATDGNAQTTTSSTVNVTVANAALTAPANLVATATSTTQISVTWGAVAGAASYDVYRRSHGGAFALIGNTVGTSFPNSGLTANTAYVYQVRAIAPGGSASPASNNDVATTIVFTDDPLVAGTTAAKAAHITQLRTAVNAIRIAAGSGSFSFTDTLASATLIQPVHIDQLRTNLTTARATLGLTAVSYTDASLVSGTTRVKAVHVQELRNGVK